VDIKTLGTSAAAPATIAGVEMLGASAKAEWTRDADGLHIRVGPPPPVPPPAVAFRLRVSPGSPSTR
jgi:hypothetical protein